MPWRTSIAHLYLDGLDVGSVEVQGWHGAWGFGDFTPNGAFSRFEPAFSRWARLLDGAGSSRRLPRELSEDLRRAEYALYRVKGHIHLPELDQWRAISVLNIDGGLIEWKEAGPARPTFALATFAQPAYAQATLETSKLPR